MTEKEKENKNSIFANGVISFILFIVISQLFTNAITSVIQLLNLIFFNFLSKYIFDDELIIRYGVYIQPTVTAFLLIVIAILIYLCYDLNNIINDPNSEGRTLVFIILIMTALFIGIIIFYYIIKYYYKAAKQKIIQKRKRSYAKII